MPVQDALRAIPRSVWDWFFEKPNCIFQVFYVALLSTCFAFLYLEAWSTVPFVDKLIGILLGVLALGLFAKVSFTDPGHITEDNILSFHRYPVHPILFPRGKSCRFLDRSIVVSAIAASLALTTSMLQYAFARYTFHFLLRASVWVNTCVAANNFGYFFAFLAVNMFGAAHLCILSLRTFMDKLESVHGTSVSTGDAREYLTNLMMATPDLTFVASMTALIWFLVSCLMGCQLSRVYRNCTTNEHFKRSSLKSKLSVDEDASPRPAAFRRPIAMDLSWGVISQDDIDEDDDEPTAEAIDANPYDQGLVANIRDAMWPPQPLAAKKSKTT
ncbi:Aste57867_20249 [Aphanomyces stellatus]|uniref:Palmitoyltransferase n=1 Tax=Aphanomyces stellatus TaxID=120398 RepID=A0A485LEJ0_9STRA|nr:hypothetical protein As57867_020183 [Aphanomyces stellatus]VFT96939.1 Aste57867_20249 [Aphanomyces stellatus]